MSQQTQAASFSLENVQALPGPAFWLDRVGAIDAIAEVWEIDPANAEAWRIDAFGDGLAQSIERLGQVVFAQRRGLVGGPALDVDVYPVIPDSPLQPVMIGVSGADGPIVCHGIEDVADLLSDRHGWGPAHVVGCLEEILAVASSLIPETGYRSRPSRDFEDAIARSVYRARTAVV
jgi:hypothetical protein